MSLLEKPLDLLCRNTACIKISDFNARLCVFLTFESLYFFIIFLGKLIPLLKALVHTLVLNMSSRPVPQLGAHGSASEGAASSDIIVHCLEKCTAFERSLSRRVRLSKNSAFGVPARENDF
ncbi:hypothetical protein Y032_0006g2975 [Ancylostoma ceylanicum]|nr:hypothetical protein Y032_0006g2975 [Ancylostoma ceylanicum]